MANVKTTIVYGVIASLIAALIVAGLKPLREYFFLIVSWSVDGILSLFIHLSSGVEIPRWLFYPIRPNINIAAF